MKKIENEKLKEIYGGGFSLGSGLLIGGFVTFIIGVRGGYVRPLACR